MQFFIVKVHLTPKTFVTEIMKLIVWRNLPQKFLDLVKSSIFCAQSKLSCGWFATAHGKSGES